MTQTIPHPINGTVNDQITDSVSMTGTLLTGYAAPQGMAMLDVAAAETFGISMQNAVFAQQNAQMTTNASITTTCARMLSMGDQGKPKPVKKPNTVPPFMPLSTNENTPVDAESLLKMAQSYTNNAASVINKQSQEKQADQQAIKDMITKLQGLISTQESGSDNSKGSGGKTDTTTTHKSAHSDQAGGT